MDCSWTKGEEKSSIAGIVRDSSGLLIDGFVVDIRATSPLHAKALALLHGLRFLNQRIESKVRAVQFEDKDWEVQYDNLALVEAILGQAVDAWAVSNLLPEIREILQQLSYVKLSYCPREANHAADWTAKSHHLKSLPTNWLYAPPQPFLNILCSKANLSSTCNPCFK